MIVFPNAKINIGLNVISKKPDGYHNLETVFYPVQLSDALELVESKKESFTTSGLSVESSPEDNLVMRALHLLKKDFDLPPVHLHLHKIIPFGAGLGGGSSDAGFALKMLNNYFSLNLENRDIEKYATKIGADCPFFINNKPVFAAGTGNEFYPVELDLSEFKIVILKPKISVSTPEAFNNIQPKKPDFNLADLPDLPIEEWKNKVVNDFEEHIFQRYPEIKNLKEKLYTLGAVFASMSGSGSAVYGIFRYLPTDFDNFIPEGVFIYR